ncbi:MULTISPECIES: phosphonate ABC transporter, permease protein PhnE [unclassified Enterococcus]|uniref:phosphonate ABC transporter, permease protein PhnE n=1 Tax=unclassified Enterococcus TaxID=2608891 RepID=UPI001CE0ACEF|nr:MULTISPECIES: phosphonate ABC transporter, permease protein PhnE [unclassified Enterococcus]MCA5013909.1 phosphonate ABC transporter, permease protein PhnE [Enterococcus sp. S23]MCA5017317.1 phosphonate ABC transporter, permease protein PhnE [Enterococcus sp. S22(2020)]
MKLKDTIHRNLYKHLFILALVLICVYSSASVTGAQMADVFNNLDQMGLFLQRFLRPDWSYLPKLVEPMLKTIKMSVVGTTIGVIFAIPFAFLATTVVTRNFFFTTIIRFLMSIVRTIPNLLLAALFVAMFGIGEFTGVLTIAVFTFGMVSQLVYEAIETIDHGPIEAAESVGATKTQVAFWSIAPQITHQIASYSLYAFEVNIRASTILGYVGAGGIGVILNSSLSLMRYDRVSIIILSILVVVITIDWISEIIRKRLV